MEENATTHSNVKESQSQQRGIATQTTNGGRGGNRGGIGRSNYQHQGGRSGGGRGGGMTPAVRNGMNGTIGSTATHV